MKIIFFTPFVSIEPHVIPEIELITGLLKQKNTVTWINCNGYMEHFCIAMSAAGLTENSSNFEKKAVCELCKNKREIILHKLKIKNYILDEYISNGEIKFINDTLYDLNKESYLNFEYQGIKIGKIASYEFFINYKKNSQILNDDEWNAYKIVFYNTFFTYFSIINIFKNQKFDLVVMHNTLYSINNIVKYVSNQINLPVYSFVSGGNAAHLHKSLMITKNSNAFLYDYCKTKSWDLFKNFALSIPSIEYVQDHIEALFNSKTVWVYSTKRNHMWSDIRTKFGINENKKIITATMSSYDERFAINTIGEFIVKKPLFSTQVEWISNVIDWIKNKNDYFLIIRVHPREFPNLREKVLSEHAKLLKQKFTNLPSNVAVNWPEDKISLYDLAEVSSCFLNAWSSAGVEMSALGIPVVLYNKEYPLYPYDLNYVGDKNIDDYFQQIELAINTGWSFDKIIQTYRWLYLLHGRTIINRNEKRKLINKFLKKHLLIQKIFRKLFSYRIANSYYFKDSDIKIVEQMFQQNGNLLSDYNIINKKHNPQEEFITIFYKLYSLLDFDNTNGYSLLHSCFENFKTQNNF